MVEDNWLSRVTGGQFELSEEKLGSLVKRLHTLSDKIDSARQQAEAMTSVQPPGKDPFSTRVAAVMNESGRAYLDSLVDQQRAISGMGNSIQKALDSYRGVEGDNGTSFRQLWLNSSQSDDHAPEGGI